MHPVRLVIIFAFATCVAAGVLLVRPVPETTAPHLLTIEQGDLLYTYHLLTGTEALFDVKEDPDHIRNLCRSRPDDAVAMHLKLARKMGVADLSEFRDQRSDPLRERLESLGYLR